MTRMTPTTPMKERTSAGIRKLAGEVATIFPDMSVHDHLKDAARELDGGRIDGAKRHLNAAIEGFAPLQITRHGVHDDEGHRTAKLFMQQSYRHLLNVRDIEDTRAKNEGLMEQRRMEAAVASGKTFLPSSQPIPVGAPNGNAGPVATPAAVAPQAQGLKALAWEDITDAIELAFNPLEKRDKGGRWTDMGIAVGRASIANTIRHDQNREPDRAKVARTLHQLDVNGEATHHEGGKVYHFKALRNRITGPQYAVRRRQAILGMSNVELVGPHGYTHNWVYHGRPGAAPEERANELSHYLAHHKLHGEDRHQAHLEAARRHHLASSLSSNPAASARHEKLARFHEKVAQQAREATIQASWAGVLDAIELVGPGGWSHGWVYHGVPKTRAAMIKHIAEGHQAGLPTGRTGFQEETRTYEDFVKVHNDLHASGRAQHSHEPPKMAASHPAKVTAGRYYGKGVSSVRDFEALASMPAFTPAQQQMLGIASSDYYAKIAAPIRATIQASWEALDRAIELSADTGRLATEPHPLGKPGGPGLWGVKGMELPPYIQNIARALLRTGRAKTLSQAIAIARGAQKRWAAGGGNVRPEVRAASQATDASWAGKQARAHAHSNWVALDRAIELAGFNPAQPRGAAGTWGGSGTTAAAGLNKKQLQQRVRADRIKLRALNVQLAKLTTIKHKTTAAAQKAGSTGKTAAATPAKRGAPVKKGAPAKAVAGKAPTRGQLITSIRAQIKQLTVQIAADTKQIAALANEPGGLLLAS